MTGKTVSKSLHDYVQPSGPRPHPGQGRLSPECPHPPVHRLQAQSVLIKSPDLQLEPGEEALQEENPRVSEAWVYLGMLRLLVKQLARAA